jgi:predicted DNA-binding transcriptional regulator YafY
VDIEYVKDDEKFYFKNAKPIKILYAEHNWYLVAMTNDEINNGLKFLRINFIKDLKERSNQFKRDPEVLDFLKYRMQSLFSSYKEPHFEVKILGTKDVARHFRYKKFLPSQRMVEREDGTFLLTYEVNNKHEIFRLVKRWLPHLVIYSPAWLKEEFDKLVQSYINRSI